ncbi:HNH endonuclease [Paraburkholderia flagellata]|uniref:HNH endonuclease n=1 Tax=Paraburkholderia flagellata TaxID=2883241 RepID=UPI001F224CE3|nr:HNH endonuclease [Paraburkholderia flagellata]
MATYLFTWNPKRWTWVDQADAIYRINNHEPYDLYWSCGNRRNIDIGDTFLLMMLGVEPKGIIGCGYITSIPYELPHWDPDKAKRGLTALRTDLLFKALSDTPIISLDYLEKRHPGYKWTPQAGGLAIPNAIADEIISLIRGEKTFDFQPVSRPEIERYSEGKSRLVTVKTYDRSPAARQACIAHHGYKCAVCGFCFEETYGALGAGYIEVHHLNQVADIDEEHLIDPITDLRPVCANCHRMLHKQRPPLSIDELRLRSGPANGKSATSE